MATILIVDDRAVNRELFLALLSYGGHHLLEASNASEALELARRELPDLIITDILMPTIDGFTLARRLRTDPRVAKVPIIFHTAYYLTEEVRKLASDCGVHHIFSKPIEPEYFLSMVNEVLIQKPKVSSLPKTKEFQKEHLQLLANKLYQKVAELEEANIRLKTLSLTDDLTGINNRRGFMVRADELLKFARRAGYQLWLLYLDLDGLKHINDTFGHASGDDALRDTAQILTQTFRASDIIARLGGDEFAVLAIDTNENSNHAGLLQSRLQSNLDAHRIQSNRRYSISLSLGVISLDLKAHFATDELLAQADAALYVNKQEKKKTRNRDE